MGRRNIRGIYGHGRHGELVVTAGPTGVDHAAPMLAPATTLAPTPTPKIVTPTLVVTPTPRSVNTPVAQSNCDPNYSGACVPNMYPADVDCAGGSGNGPYYVKGPVTVIGVDRYKLDANHDGVGCEN